MAKRRKLLFFCLLLAAVALALWLLVPGGRPYEGVEISFMGYTNLPNNTVRFALFSVQGRNSSAVRWRGYQTEVEGLGYGLASITANNLPFLQEPTLGARKTLEVAVGEPNRPGRWRLVTFSVANSPKQRLFDFFLNHRWPMKIGPIRLFDDQKMLNPANNVTNYSEWLDK